MTPQQEVRLGADWVNNVWANIRDFDARWTADATINWEPSPEFPVLPVQSEELRNDPASVYYGGRTPL